MATGLGLGRNTACVSGLIEIFFKVFDHFFLRDLRFLGCVAHRHHTTVLGLGKGTERRRWGIGPIKGMGCALDHAYGQLAGNIREFIAHAQTIGFWIEFKIITGARHNVHGFTSGPPVLRSPGIDP